MNNGMGWKHPFNFNYALHILAHERTNWYNKFKEVYMITLKELAKEINASERMIRKMIKQGMPHYKVGSDYRFKLAEVEEWMKPKEE